MSKIPSLATRTTSGSVDTEIVAVFQDPGKKPIPPRGPYGKAMGKFRRGDAFAARSGSTQFVRFGGKKGAESVLFAGFGLATDMTDEKARAAGGAAWGRLMAEKAATVAVDVDAIAGAKGLKSDGMRLGLARAFAEGLVLGAYQFNKYKKPAEPAAFNGPSKIVFVSRDGSMRTKLDTELARIEATVEACNVTRDWSNEPSNFGTPEYFADEAKKLAKRYGLKCRVLTEADAKREKMGLFLGVGQGSEREGRIIVLEYAPKGAKKTLAFVGKGVTFDSGGVSIKPSMRMEEMKHDMTGAATVLGATLLAAKWKAPTRIITILACTENMPDGDAIAPGNVLRSRAGKTVEVINTDAEGRLVLADALDFVQDFKPDAVIDAATLTGAVSIALGKLCGAVLGNDEDLIEKIRSAGEANGERIWQLPLFDDYFEDMKSDTADMKNSCNDSNGGVIRGAIFLKQFIRKGVPWAHLDIAATCYNLTHLSYMPKRGAAGTYVRTLARLAMDF